MTDDIFDELKSDHETQRTLMRLLLKTHGASNGRKELFARLRKAMEQHAATEERVLYAAMLETHEARQHAAHSVHEHEQMRDMLDALEQMDMSSSGWLKCAEKMVEKNRHHLKEEENEIFPAARELFSKKEQRELGAEFREVEPEEENPLQHGMD